MMHRLLIIVLLAVPGAAPALAQDAPIHVVTRGQTLSGIAQTHGTSVVELKRLNGLSGDLIRIGQVLLLRPGIRAAVARPESPLRSATSGIVLRVPPAYADAARPISRPTSPKVDSPDAERDAGPAADVNPLATADTASADIAVGEASAAPDSPVWTAEPADKEPASIHGEDAAPFAELDVTTHVVEAGETLYSIAAERGTTAYILFALNDEIRGPLEPGLPLSVPASEGAATYVVRPGDTLTKIAADHGTTVAALREANELDSDVLSVDETLRLPGAAASGEAVQGGSPTYAIGSATVLPESSSGRTTASGSVYEAADFVVAHRELPFETLLVVEHYDSGRATFARVTDRGPADISELLAMSPAVAGAIGFEPGDLVRIRLVE